MKYDVMSQTAKLLQQYKKNKRWLAVFLCLAVTVVLGTLAALKLYGQAMTHKVKVLECKYEVHEHTEECYDEENGEELICVYADYVVHVHNDDCYDAEGKLLCPLEEVEPHEHTEDCYEEIKVLVCEEETAEPAEGENAGAEGTAQNNEAAQEPVKGDLACTQEEHTHGEGCYSRMIACEEKEHVHEDACYSNELICEGEEHTHGEGCYDEEGNLICTAEEHTHNDGYYNQELICEVNEHTHGEGCYNSELVCETEEHEHADTCYQQINSVEDTHEAKTKEHVHTDECYVTEKVLACGKLELHTHTDECYAKESFDEEGKLIEGSLPICGLLQLEEHVHGEECFVTVELTPEEVEALKDGAALHVHDEKCYDEEGNLICGHEATHIHGPECYDEEGKLICELAETHVHSEECYDAEGNLICGHSLGAHVHEAKCYNEEGKLICGYETAAHPHVASCYDAEGNLQCGYETAAHVHEEGCYDEEGNVICGYAAASHVHGKECYDENGTLICGYETAKHVHEDSCYDQEGNLVCGYNENGLAASALYCDESIHTHDADCYDAEGNLICGKADFAVHKHTDDCYNINGVLICPLPEAEAHVHGAECYPEGTAEGGAEPACGKQEIRLHTHTEECCDENGALICGQLEILEHVHGEACRVSNRPITKTFEGGSFIVTAVYKPDANIPEEAELIAEQITEESDSEHYAKRQAEYQEALGDSKATMRALLKVGFYVNGEEVEPESPVTLTIQFLDENGLAEGKPVTVIHFAEEGAEVLEGSEVQDGSTTFEMDSFSEIGVGDGQKSVRVPINEELTYETDEFEVTFHIEGEVSVPVDSRANQDKNNDVQSIDNGSGITEKNQNDVSHKEGENSTKINDEESPFPTEDENTFIIPIESQNLEKNLEFKVETLGEDSEEYANAVVGAESISEADEILLLNVLSYSLEYDDVRLDLSGCTVTIEIAPTQMLVDYTEEVGSIATLELDEQLSQEDLQLEVVITALKGQSEGAASEIMNAMVVNSDTANESISFVQESEDNNVVAVVVTTSQVNPPFHVEYWAYLDRTVIGGIRLEDGSKGEVPANAKKELDVIDTDGHGVPKNGTELFTTKIFLDKEGNVISEEKLTQVYSKRDYEYILAPNLTYFDALLENESYILKEVWTLDHDHDKDACYKRGELICDKTHEHGWGCYKQTLNCPYANPSAIPDTQWKKSSYWLCGKEHEHDDSCKHLRFTNRRETAEGEDSNEYVLISWDKAIRLIYDTTEKNGNISSTFYDYDISDGSIRTDGDAKIINTMAAGINSTDNCNARVKYAFGNNNAGTNYGTNVWKYNGLDNELNKFNKSGGGFKGCTFELVSRTDGKKDVVFNVDAPVVFGEGDSAKQVGKTIFTQYGLDFKQSGDTYTLTGVSKKKGEEYLTITGNLDKFINTNTTKDIWSNNFWPMDDAATWGAAGHDMKFGNNSEENKDNLRSEPGKNKWNALPVSDDGLDHNSYFGMYFAVTFELTEEYVGPLEYLFFGDDDMWVFLDDNTLVCDIGGVHSSVGEYVNLWNYLPKGSSGTHTLKFFYTERGASGSSCWMQFTLPSVTGFEPSQGYGELKIEKTAENFEAGKDFSFDIAFSDAKGNGLQNDYAYTKYQKTFEIVDGKEVEGSKVIEHDIIIWNGGHFTLKDNEFIVITFLPIGTKYTITETDSGNCYTDIVVDGTKKENLTTDKTAEGTIISEGQGNVSYRNYRAYALPETGGSGTIILYTIAGAIVLLGGTGFLYKRKFRERRGEGV